MLTIGFGSAGSAPPMTPSLPQDDESWLADNLPIMQSVVVRIMDLRSRGMFARPSGGCSLRIGA
jgi:hypothetical protein